MAVAVVIESAADHGFDLGHLRREGGEELVGRLLHEAGYDGQRWRVRVEKKIACGAETRPVAVVGCKPWCCYLKIKPGDNETGHYCSLLMPEGLRGDAVYEALKRVEDRIDRNWRHDRAAEGRAAPRLPPKPAALAGAVPEDGTAAGASPAEPAALASEAPPAVPEEPLAAVPEDAAAGTVLRQWTKDSEKVRLTLLVIHDLGLAGPLPSKTAFVDALADKLGWQGANRHEIGGVFAWLVRLGYIEALRQGSKALGYGLTARGKQVVHDLLPAETTGPAPAAPAAGDAATLLLDFGGLAQELAEATRRLQANRARRAELTHEVERLDAEARELSRVLADPEVQDLVRRLLRATSGGGRPA